MRAASRTGREQHEVAHVVRLLDDQPAPHVGFTRADLRIARDMVRRLSVGEAYADRLARARSVLVNLPVVIGDDEPSVSDQPFQHLVEQQHGARH